MFGYALPLRSTTLIQMDCTSQQENEGGTPRLPLRVRANQVKDMTSKRQSQLDKKNEKLRENQYQVGDLVLKQVMQHTTVGTRHALECRYTGPYEIISIESSSVTLDSPSAKFATPVKCHVDQLKPFVLPDSPSTSPAWDQGLRHQINVPLSPISSRTRKRSHPMEQNDKQSEPPSKTLTRSTTAKTDQKVLQPTDVQTSEVTITAEDAPSSEPNTEGQRSSSAQNRATSPFRAEASALNRPKLGRLGQHLHRKSAKNAAATTDETLLTDSTAPTHPNRDKVHQKQNMCGTHTSDEVTGSLPNEITASSAAANGQAPAQQEQQTPMMPSHLPLGQSPTENRSPQAVVPMETRQPLQADWQPPHILPIKQPTTRASENKESLHQAPATPLQGKNATTKAIQQRQDKETQATVTKQDAMVQTDTLT